MNPDIVRDGDVEPREIEDLREAVGWDRCEGTYASILNRHYTYYTVRAQDGSLIGYMSVLSDGISDAFLLDLMVHPGAQRTHIRMQLVERAIQDVKDAGVQCVQVTFSEDLREFYAKCGFHIFGGGIIDFKNMDWNAGRQPGHPSDAEDCAPEP
jgi:GNAT superfamily N-acetyltransferase